MEDVRYILIYVVSAVVSFLAPIQDFMVATTIVFVTNFVCGLVSDIVHGDGWDTKKALLFFRDCFIYFGLITFVYANGHFLHNETAAVQSVSYIGWVALWIYTVNILRNLLTVTKQGSMYTLLSFLYYVLSFKMIEKIPYLAEWQKSKK